MDSYNLTHTGAELDSAVGRALEGFAAADAATKAANDAAKLAEDTAAEVQKKLDNGEFIGPIGKSGVYVGSGEMPEGYTVQVDPTGDMLCYTAGESDDRYANVLTGTASGAVVCLEDVSPVGPLRRAAALGATTETGEGDKGSDNPYTFTGVQPASLTVCGRNLLDLSEFTLKSQGTAIYQDGKIAVTNANGWAGTALIFDTVFPPASYCIKMNEANRLISDSDEIPLAAYNDVYNGYGRPYFSNTYVTTLKFTATKPFTVGFICKAGDSVVYPQIEIGSAATPYEPYTGQTIPLPTLAPLYGDGTVCDEYDAATGVETRRWGRVELDGTEAWATSATETAGKYRVSLSIADVLPTTTFSQVSSCRCSHYTTISADNTYHLQVGISANYGTSHGIFIYDDAYDAQDLTDWKAYLAAQAAAGTPVTVVYQLAEPVITQHDPARILPPAPVCRVFADAGTVEAGYNRDVNMAFEQQRAEYLARIEALDARIAKLEAGAPAELMT